MLTSIALILLSGLFFSFLFTKMKLPGLLGMILVGIILGPHALNLIDTSILDISADLRQIALVIILTRAGLSLNLTDLKKIGRPAVFMSFLPACIEMAAVVVFAPLLLGVSYLDSAIAAGYQSVTLVHGKGTGALKAALWKYIKNDKRIRSYRLGRYGEGDTGVTIVELK